MSTPALDIYHTIGPFDRASVPEGLLREHSLKPGTWGRITVLSGSVGLAWDDDADEAVELGEGDTLVIPPVRPHHLVPTGAFELTIDFLREA